MVEIIPVTGNCLGSFDKYASFPTNGAIGDYAVLRFDDGANVAGVYACNGAASYTFQGALNGTLKFTLGQIKTRLNNITIADLPSVSQAINDALVAYAKKSDILVDVNAEYIKFDQLWLKFVTYDYVQSEINDITTLYNDLSALVLDMRTRVNGFSARVDAIEARVSTLESKVP
jgi:hypothetical protein